MLNFLQDELPSNSWITKDTNESLFQAATPVTLPLSKKDLNTMYRMIDWVNASQNSSFNKNKKLTEAVGIAAAQIGENIAMYYISIPTSTEADQKEAIIYKKYAMINAKIIARSAELAALSLGEGCLSVDKQHEGYVPRSYKVIVQGYDFLMQKNVTLTIRGYEAIVFQHEHDHLQGKLYYHHINRNDPFDVPENCHLI